MSATDNRRESWSDFLVRTGGSATYVERTGNIFVHHPVKPRPAQAARS